jgi:cAMP-dependent protein kinase regulator
MDDFVPPVYEKSPDQIQKLIEILKNNFLTKNLSQFELKILADAMQLRFYKRNDMIIRYGDVGDEYFILDRGVIEI